MTQKSTATEHKITKRLILQNVDSYKMLYYVWIGWVKTTSGPNAETS